MRLCPKNTASNNDKNQKRPNTHNTYIFYRENVMWLYMYAYVHTFTKTHRHPHPPTHTQPPPTPHTTPGKAKP